MFTIIAGKRGRGKTALMSFMLANEIMSNGFSDYVNCKREILKLNAGGFNLEPPPLRHTCFADYDFKSSKISSAYSINGFEIGLKNPFFKTVYLPPYSKIFLDEAQKYYDSRMSIYLREEVYRWFQLSRHNNYDITMTCQRLANIDINIRSLADEIIVIDSIDVKKDEYGLVKKVIWQVHKFEATETAEKYQLNSDNEQIAKLGKKEIITSSLPIFKYYNSFGCKPAFYKSDNFNNLKFEYFSEAGYEFTLDSFVEFNNSHYFVAPEGYYKNASNDKKLLERGFLL